MVYVRLYLTVGVLFYGLSKVVSDSRNALSWSQVTARHHLSDDCSCLTGT